MTLKLTIQQAEALRKLFEDLVIHDLPVDVNEKLLQIILIKIYKKLRNRHEARLKGTGYSISLTDEEAIAYYLYFKDRHLVAEYLYEASFIHQHIGQIDQVYA